MKETSPRAHAMGWVWEKLLRAKDGVQAVMPVPPGVALRTRPALVRDHCLNASSFLREFILFNRPMEISESPYFLLGCKHWSTEGSD